MKIMKVNKDFCYITLLISMIFIFAGCADSDNNDNFEGGPCEYVKISGTATITSIVDASDDAYNCDNEPVEVLFDFVPDDPDVTNDYLFPNTSDSGRYLRVGEGQNPPRNYMNDKGIIVGSSHNCVRNEILNGTCTPVFFQFPEIDFSDYGDYCW